MQGTVKGGRRQGRQRKRWEDIREWTGLEFAKSQRAVESREKWRKLFVKSSVVPQRPSRLRDRYDRYNDDDETETRVDSAEKGGGGNILMLKSTKVVSEECDLSN